MKIKTCFLIFFLTIGFMTPTCNVEDDLNCSCPPLEGEYFDIQGFEVFNYKVGENSTSIARLDENESIPFSRFHGMLIDFESIYHSCNVKQKSWGFSLMNSALACSCVENGFEGSQTERLESLTILTLNDFSNEYLANDTLNNLLVVPDFNGDTPLNTYLEQDTALIQSEYLWLDLLEAPTFEEDFQLKIIIELSTDEVYEVETSAIRFE